MEITYEESTLVLDAAIAVVDVAAFAAVTAGTRSNQLTTSTAATIIGIGTTAVATGTTTAATAITTAVTVTVTAHGMGWTGFMGHSSQ